MDYVQICGKRVSRLILGSNPFSGFSHLGADMDLEMMRYFKTEKIKETIRQAESLGINTIIARADHHIMRVLLEYWDEGGKMQWFAQTCPELGPIRQSVLNAIAGKAAACYIHGGVADNYLAQEKTDEFFPIVEQIHEAGMPAGIAGHRPEVFQWAEQHLDIDYYMCSYYNPIARDENPEHVRGMSEVFQEQDRQAMTSLIPGLARPVIHYKIMGAGRNDPEESFDVAAGCMRDNDAVCIGVYTEKSPGMIEENIKLLEKSLAGRTN